MGKTNFNMQITDEEKSIMDFVVDVIYKEYEFSKADVVSMLIKKCAIDYLGLDVEYHQIPDNFLLTLLHEKKKEDDFAFLQMVGIDKYKNLVEGTRKGSPDLDLSYFEGLIKKYEEMEGNK